MTSEVGSRSPLGDSLHGVQDMAGNVWEFALTSEEFGGEVARGGSLLSNYSVYFQADHTAAPGVGYNYGFRCVGATMID